MLSLFFGLLAILAGLWGMWNWSGDLIHFLKGMVPISLFFAGLIAIIAGMSSLSSKPPPPSKKG